MPDVIPYFDMGEAITGVSTAAITGGRFVKIDPASTWNPVGLKGDTQLPPATSVISNVPNILPAVAGDKAFGVAMRDAAIGKPVGVLRSPGMVLPVEVGAAVTAGQEVQSDGSGRAIPLATGKALGLALGPQATVGQTAPIALY